jgi:isopenicillin-N N-acyltransferase-like protein
LLFRFLSNFFFSFLFSFLPRYGAWGSALAQTNSRLMQLRALDWDVDGPFKNFPQITVYHPTPNSGNGHPFANIGWTGWIGSITGFSSVQMAISEIGVAFPDSTFGKESRFGVPFTYVLRDILQFDEGIEAARMHLRDAKRNKK